jgi:hypothetical protein
MSCTVSGRLTRQRREDGRRTATARATVAAATAVNEAASRRPPSEYVDRSDFIEFGPSN